jgi:hypothetical protein
VSERKLPAHSAILNVKECNLITFLKRLQRSKHETVEIETGMAEKSRRGQANRQQKLLV